MKQLSIVVMGILLLYCTGCIPERFNPYRKETPEETILIQVECRNEPAIQQTVVQLLKLGRVADWSIQKNGETEEIESRYRSLIYGRAEYIKEQLEQVRGVLYVEIKRDGMPVKNPFL